MVLNVCFYGVGNLVSNDNAFASQLLKDDTSSEGFGGKSSEITEITKEEIKASALNNKIVFEYPTRHATTSIGSKDVSNIRTQSTFFNSRRLNLCVIETENLRACCAFIVAVLVLLKSSIITSRPLPIMLLNDVMLVLVRMYLNMQKSIEEAAQGKRVGLKEDNQNWGGAVKVLERSLAAYQAFRGVFIDWSIYVVVVVCGLSLK